MSASITYIDTHTSAASNDVTFSGISIGTPASDRLVCVAVYSRGDFRVLSLTIAGVSATPLSRSEVTATNAPTQTEIWLAKVPTNYVAEVRVQATGSQNFLNISVVTVTGVDLLYDWAWIDANATDFVLPGECVVIGAQVDLLDQPEHGFAAWSGITTIGQYYDAAGFGHSMTVAGDVLQAGTVSLSCNVPSNPEYNAACVAVLFTKNSKAFVTGKGESQRYSPELESIANPEQRLRKLTDTATADYQVKFSGNLSFQADYLSFTDATGRLNWPAPNLNSGATISLWVKSPTAVSDQKGVFGISYGGSNRCYIATRNNVWEIGLSGNTAGSGIVGTPVAVSTNWVHLCLACDPQAGIGTLYVDGVETHYKVFSAVNSSIDIFGVGAIATSVATDTWRWDGLLGDILIFDHALNSSQVSEIKQLGRGYAVSTQSIVPQLNTNNLSIGYDPLNGNFIL